MVLWWLASAAMAQSCPDRSSLLDGLRDLTAAGATTAAGELLDDVVDSFGCGGRARSHELVGLWLAMAALRDARGEVDAADVALRGARRLGDTFDDAYGRDLGRRWQRMHTAPILPSRLATVARRGTSLQFFVDGLRLAPPGLLEAGLHLVQWGPAEDAIVGARIVTTQVDVTTTIDVRRDPAVILTQPPPSFPAAEASPRGRSPALLIVAGIAGASALVTTGLAATVGPSTDVPPDAAGDALTRRLDRQRALGITSFGLMAISGLSLAIHIQR